MHFDISPFELSSAAQNKDRHLNQLGRPKFEFDSALEM